MLENIIEIIAEVLQEDVSKISAESDIMESLGADSIDIIDIIAEIEEKYGVKIPDEVIPDFRFVKDIAEYIKDNN